MNLSVNDQRCKGGKPKMKKLSAAVVFAAATMLVWAASVGAVDGTIEINQAKVLAAGGFPYRINASGSYRLTGNLTVSSTSADAIDVSVNHVTIDLNGFAINGPGGSSGSGNGINGQTVDALTVENGAITGFPAGFGVETGNNGIVRNVQSNTNGDGILVQGGGQPGASVISGDTANNNAGTGISCGGSGCLISGNTAVSNGSNGIQCSGSGCPISGNTAISNGNNGIQCGGSGCAISNNIAISNFFDGISCGSGCVISNSTTISNTSFGIGCSGSGCLVTGNTILNSPAATQAADATTGYSNNVLNGNTTNFNGGTSLGAKNTNLCSGTAC